MVNPGSAAANDPKVSSSTGEATPCATPITRGVTSARPMLGRDHAPKFGQVGQRPFAVEQQAAKFVFQLLDGAGQ